MKAIRITPRNTDALEAALKAVNGRAHAHTYILYAELQDVADNAEARAVVTAGSRKNVVGAVVCSTSGKRMPDSYAKRAITRTATRITIERRATGWFLQRVKRVDVGPQGGGVATLVLARAPAFAALVKS
jgi:hypothetical protein